MQKYIMAIDQGTTSCRALLFDESGAIVSIAQQEFAQYFPNPGWVEHDAMEIWETQLLVCKKALEQKNIGAEALAGIGIANQRETTVVWDKKTGIPLYNAIVWQDRRTAADCSKLKDAGYANLIREKTGLVIDAYFSASKIKWILDHITGARARAENGDLCAGTIDSWLLWKLTNGSVHGTDVTNASRTMLYNIHQLTWDPELLALFNIPGQLLPAVYSSSEIYGSTSLLGYPVSIAGIAGDQQSALFGQMCTSPGMVKNTYGTGCFMLLQTGTVPIKSNNNLLTTIALQINGTTTYALEGSVFIAGAVVQWLRDSLGIIKKSSDVEALVKQTKQNDGVYFVPAFAGLGAPYWDQNARGTITGLTRGTGAAHIARAAIESIAYQVNDVLTAMELDAGIKISALRVDGGATVNDMLMQFQSDLLNTKVTRPLLTETTAMGAAYLAGLATGFWKNTEAIQHQWKTDRDFIPQLEEPERTRLLDGWKKAVAATLQPVIST